MPIFTPKPTTKTLTVQSASSPADLQYDLKPEELKILTSNSLKEIPLEQRLGTLNGIIKEDFAGSITMDVLNSKESINIPLTDKAKVEIEEQMAWWTTTWDGVKWATRSAGKQPAWMNYMTAVNKTYGNLC